MKITDAKSTLLTGNDKIQATDVLLISMPFGPAFYPSLGLSSLKQSLLSHSPITVSIEYFNLLFTSIIGVELYSEVAAGVPTNHDLFGEWLFSQSLFNLDQIDNDQDYIHYVLLGKTKEHAKQNPSLRRKIPKWLKKSLIIRQQIEPFLARCLEQVKRHNPTIIGFTSVFQQQIASLSLAKKIKEWNADITIVFGGANNEAEMGREVIRQFPFVDAVVSGEGEIIFPELVSKILNKENIDKLPGVITSQNTADNGTCSVPPVAPITRNMDSLPMPVYDDYFDQLNQYQLSPKIFARLLFETSRGCWWGEVSHCTFCGLNGSTMLHRSKSASRAIEEIEYMMNKYPGHSLSVVDNILDMKYFKDFIPTLVEKKLGVDLFYEVKSNLSKDQVAMLSNAGIKTIQPGIESLSDSVLKLMGKGVKTVQNLQLLKWCKELGITPFWNMIWGFPGEPEEEYDQMAGSIQSFTHLYPPGGYSPLRLDRFSPNFTRSSVLGFSNVRPYPAYQYVYPYKKNVLENLAYYFAYDYAANRDPGIYTKRVVKALNHWQKNYNKSDLFFVDKDSFLLVWDFRFEVEQLIVLSDIYKFIYLECDSYKTLWNIQEAVKNSSYSINDLQGALDQLIRSKLLYTDGVHYLSLALPLGTYTPNVHGLKRLQKFVNKHASSHTSPKSTVTLDLSDFLLNKLSTA